MNEPVVSQKNEPLQLDSAAFTDRGRKRELNQDSIFHQTSHTENGENIGLFLVCDGMGGHQAGEVASHIAMEVITRELSPLFSLSGGFSHEDKTQPSYLRLSQNVETAVIKANDEIRQYAKNHPDEASKMGTTVTLVLIRGRLAHVINVGDGRVYAWREGELTQITRDHSLAAKMAEIGEIDEAEIAHHPRSNIIYRSLGMDTEIEVDVFDWELEAGDKLLLCSDGLWKAFGTSKELAQWLGTQTTPADLCQQLVTQAKHRDGSDNISAIVVAIGEGEPC